MRQPLGIGGLIGRTARLTAVSLPRAAMIGLPLVAALLIVDLGLSQLIGQVSGLLVRQVLGYVRVLLGFAVLAALLTQVAHDRALGRPLRPMHYVRVALIAFPTLATTAVLLGTAIVLWNALLVYASVVSGYVSLAEAGFLALLLGLAGMLWLMASVCLTVPTAVIERVGWRAPLRAIELVRGHRLGTMALLLVVVLVSSFAIGASLAAFVRFVPLDPFPLDWLVLRAWIGVVLWLIAHMTGTLLALLHLRLREIKDGLGMESMPEVFE